MKLRGLARVALLIIPVAGAAGAATLPQLARAAGTTITVGSFDDPVTPGDCSGVANGTSTCTLRAAVKQANLDNNADVIKLGVGTYTLKQNASAGNGDDGTLGDLEVSCSQSIQGAGATQSIIQGVGPDANTAWNDRIIEVEDTCSSTPSLAISGLTITGGKANANAASSGEADGGAILAAPATLSLNNVVVDGNTSTANGGGVASESGSTGDDGSITVTHSTISTNTAEGNGGGLFVSGKNTALDTFSNLWITGNTANGSFNPADSGGGGVYDDVSGSGATFTDIMVTGNKATGMSGGGIYEGSQNASAPDVTPQSSYKNVTLSGNRALVAGGGFYAALSLTSLTNATITGNTTTGTDTNATPGGGGIANGFTGSVTVNNATINGNTSAAQGGGVASLNNGDHIHLHNTIVVKNTVGSTSSDCFIGTGSPGPTIDSTGYNIVDDLTCALVPATDRQGPAFNPNLGVLKDNTGPSDGATGAVSATLTEALPEGSIAIDTADPTVAKDPATDERGVTRPQRKGFDVGAYEALPAFVAPVLPAAGHPAAGSLPAAPWALLVLAMVAALGAVRLGVRTSS